MNFKDKATLEEVNKISEILTYLVNKYDIKSKSLNTLKETLIKRCGATLKEDLIDDTPQEEKSNVEPLSNADESEENNETQQVAFGITGLLGNAIQNAWNNVGEYNSILATISSMGDLQDLEVEKISSIISSILDDEMVKIGKLEEAMQVVQPSVDLTNEPIEEQLHKDEDLKTPKDPFKMTEIDFFRVFEESTGLNWNQAMICDNVWDRLVFYLGANGISASYPSGIIRINNKKIFQISYDHEGRNEWAIHKVKTFNCPNLKSEYNYPDIDNAVFYLDMVKRYGTEYAEQDRPSWLKINDQDTELLEKINKR